MGYPGFIFIISFKYSVFQILTLFMRTMYTMFIYMYGGMIQIISIYQEAKLMKVIYLYKIELHDTQR